MRFETPRRPTPYLNSRDQWRMLRLVGLLALVLVGMNVAADPDTWAWMFPEEGKDEVAERVPSIEEVDFGVKMEESDAMPPGVFRSEVSTEPLAEREVADEPRPEPAAPADCRDVRVDREQIDHVRDDTLGVRRAEADAFYATLAKARDIPADCLAEAARDDVAFAVLMTNSDEFRGIPITVTGEIKRLNALDAVENAYGIATFYEAWLFTSDSGDNPYRIVTASAPEGLPRGDIDGEARVRVTGYFFKREGYAAEGGLHKAPLLIGKTLEPLPRRPAGIPMAQNFPLTRYIVGGAAVVLVLLGIAVWAFNRSDRKFKREHLDRMAVSGGKDSPDLNELQESDPGEYLRRLEEQGGEERRE